MYDAYTDARQPYAEPDEEEMSEEELEEAIAYIQRAIEADFDALYAEEAAQQREENRRPCAPDDEPF